MVLTSCCPKHIPTVCKHIHRIHTYCEVACHVHVRTHSTHSQHVLTCTHARVLPRTQPPAPANAPTVVPDLSEGVEDVVSVEAPGLSEAIDGIRGLALVHNTFTSILKPELPVPKGPAAVEGDVAGVGLELAEARSRTRRMLVIKKLAPAGPAAKQGGIQAGDELVRIDGVEVSDLPLDRIKALLIGPIESSTTLTLRRTAARPDLGQTGGMSPLPQAAWSVEIAGMLQCALMCQGYLNDYTCISRANTCALQRS